MEEVYVLLYTRSSLEPVQDSMQLPRILSYAVGEPTEEFLKERTRAAELSAEQENRAAKKREAALQRRAAKRARVDAGSSADLLVLDS